MRDQNKSGMSSSGSEHDESLGADEKIGTWSNSDDDGGVLAGNEDVGIWSDEEGVEEGYQADATQPGGEAASESEKPDSAESRWGSDDSHSRR